MIIYEYICTVCKQVYTAARSVENRYDSPPCTRCGVATERHYTPTAILVATYQPNGERSQYYESSRI